MSDYSVISRKVSLQAPLSMGFPRQEYCSGFSFPPPGDLPDSWINPVSPALAGGFFITEPPGKPTSKDGEGLWRWGEVLGVRQVQGCIVLQGEFSQYPVITTN